MRKYLKELEVLCDEVIGKYPFIQEENVRQVRLLDRKDLLILFEDGQEIIFDKFLYERVMTDYPTIRETDIEYVNKVGEYDLLIKFKDDSAMVYDTFNNISRGVYDIEELPDEIFIKEFSRNLKKVMKQKFINQEELAKRIGVSQAMISKYMTGQSIPNAIMIKKIANALNCSTEDFYYSKF